MDGDAAVSVGGDEDGGFGDEGGYGSCGDDCAAFDYGYSWGAAGYYCFVDCVFAKYRGVDDDAAYCGGEQRGVHHYECSVAVVRVCWGGGGSEYPEYQQF